MKYRNYFMCFSAGFALATIIVRKDAFIWNYVTLFMFPMGVLWCIAFYHAFLKKSK